MNLDLGINLQMLIGLSLVFVGGYLLRNFKIGSKPADYFVFLCMFLGFFLLAESKITSGLGHRITYLLSIICVMGVVYFMYKIGYLNRYTLMLAGFVLIIRTLLYNNSISLDNYMVVRIIMAILASWSLYRFRFIY